MLLRIKPEKNNLHFCLSNTSLKLSSTRECEKWTQTIDEYLNLQSFIWHRHLKLDLNVQTLSPRTELFPQLTASRLYDFYLAVFSCLAFMLIVLYILLFPQVPQEPPAEDHQAGHWPGGRLHQVGSSASSSPCSNKWLTEPLWLTLIKEWMSLISLLYCNKLKASWGWCETAAC